MAHTLIEANEAMHALIRAAWLAAPVEVPFTIGKPPANAAAFGIVYALRDGNGEPDLSKVGRVPWCRISVINTGAGRQSIGGRRRANRGFLVVQIFVPNDRSSAGGVALRLAQLVKSAMDRNKTFVDLYRSRYEGNPDVSSDSGAYKSAIVAADFEWTEISGS